ncbi:MAG: hypothetical protein DRI95_07725 [Bacteroidetes bacterium]|nr:MAG: hypothetical protein DRI95_07725 [Bacteroidota bacterium]
MYKRTIINKLREWKNKSNRKPLILRGARQVGKTTLVEMFAKEFDYFIYLNLDKAGDLQIFEQNDNLNTIISILFLQNSVPTNKKQDKILIFIDEIQNSPKTVALLRYFMKKKTSFTLLLPAHCSKAF